MYDVAVVGARCAGSPTAMLLARKGYRVLLVDRASFPSDTISTHFIHPPGVARLQRWGILEDLVASNCPPIERYRLDVGPFALSGRPPAIDGVATAYAPRRTVLDKILVDAAVGAGVELREKFVVDELVFDGGRVSGIRGHSTQGATSVDRARIVVGADGAHSLVARMVQAETTHEKPAVACCYYTYWSGVSLDAAEIYPRDRRMIVTFPTNDDLVTTVIEWPREEFDVFRSDIERNFLKTIDLVPALGARMRGAERAARFAGSADLPNFFRKPYGPGWALVGDAGHHKDPNGAFGISDAFRDVELLADAIDAGLSGRAPMDDALAEYERRRNEAAMPTFELNHQFATLQPPPPPIQALFAALQGNQPETNRFFGAVTGTVPIPAFFAPDNISRIVGATVRS